MVCVFGNSGGSSAHCITGTGKFQHFYVILLIAETDTFVFVDAEMVHQCFECSTFIRIWCNKVDPAVSYTHLYTLMDKLASEGKAILMISSEMQEVVGMSDRIYIMSNGSIVGNIERHEFAIDKIGRMMLLGS